MNDLSLARLRTFAMVVEAGSFSAAAARLGLTQPAVSLQLRELERQLGVRLLERAGRRAVPTAAGRSLMDHTARIEASVSAALDAMADYAGGLSGRVLLGTGATACIYLFPPILRELRRLMPGIEFVVRTGITGDILRQVEEASLDIALVTLPAASRSLTITPVMEDEFVLIALKDEAAGLPRDLTPEAVAGLPVLLYEPRALTRTLVDEWAGRAGVTLKPVMELGSVEAIKQLVAAGLGCAILPSMAVPSDGRLPLVSRPLSPPLSRQLGIVLRTDKVLTRPLKAMIAALQRVARDRGTAV